MVLSEPRRSAFPVKLSAVLYSVFYPVGRAACDPGVYVMKQIQTTTTTVPPDRGCVTRSSYRIWPAAPRMSSSPENPPSPRRLSLSQLSASAGPLHLSHQECSPPRSSGKRRSAGLQSASARQLYKASWGGWSDSAGAHRTWRHGDRPGDTHWLHPDGPGGSAAASRARNPAGATLARAPPPRAPVGGACAPPRPLGHLTRPRLT